MKLTLGTIITVAAGVLAMDYLFGKGLPKWLEKRQLSASCHCGGACDSCAKNITDRAQVIDVTPLRSEVRAS